VALRRFVAEDPTARQGRWLAVLEGLREAAGLDGLRLEAGPIPHLALDCGSEQAAVTLARRLAAGVPSIACAPGRRERGVLGFSPVALTIEEARIVGARLKELAG
jgi:hypothetical protein